MVIDPLGPKFQWWAPEGHVKWDGGRIPNNHQFRGMEPYETDVLVIQRPTLQFWVQGIPLLQAQGIRVVVDVDDLVDDVHRRNVAAPALRGEGPYGEREHARFVDEACKLADLVTVTTPALLERYGHGHGIVLPNLVPEAYLSVFGLKQPETVGWSGVLGVHPVDLQATGGGVGAAIGAPWRFHVIGSPFSELESKVLAAAKVAPEVTIRDLGTDIGVRKALGLHCPLSATGYVPFAEYPMALAELEIGIVPLTDSAFNRSKSALKSAEMSSLGVPVVMSPTPDNLRLHKLGIGLVAESRGQWKRHVERLIASASMRYEMGEAAREIMAGQTYEGNCWRWHEAWTGQAKERVA